MIDKFYGVLPERLQDWAVSYQGWRLKEERFGRDFDSAFNGFMERSNWSFEMVIEYQKKKLSQALERASRTPFYQRVFSELRADWRDFTDLKNFKKLPIVTKENIRNNLNEFRPRLPEKSDKLLKTSGTTGESFAFPVSKNVEPEQWALWSRYRMWHGIRRGEKCALFASAPIVRGELNRRPWRYNKANNEFRFSIFHISKETAPIYVDALNEIKPLWIHGNPTAIALLSSYIVDLKLKISFIPKCITVGSENFLGWQRDAIKKAFNAPISQHYGQAEAVANISQCECGNLHTDEDYSFVEYLNEDTAGSFSIVGTPFNNYALSILRYVTGDLVTLDSAPCCCGHPGRIVKTLDGRLTDYILLPGGKRVASLAAPFHNTDSLAGAQIYQDKKGDLVIRYIPGKGWRDDLLKELEKGIRIRVGQEIKISFMEVDKIEKTPRGKMKLVVSDYQK